MIRNRSHPFDEVGPCFVQNVSDRNADGMAGKVPGINAQIMVTVVALIEGHVSDGG
jgi:hypothetical protein